MTDITNGNKITFKNFVNDFFKVYFVYAIKL